jgi:hypothetical protein
LNEFALTDVIASHKPSWASSLAGAGYGRSGPPPLCLMRRLRYLSVGDLGRSGREPGESRKVGRRANGEEVWSPCEAHFSGSREGNAPGRALFRLARGRNVPGGLSPGGTGGRSVPGGLSPGGTGGRNVPGGLSPGGTGGRNVPTSRAAWRPGRSGRSDLESRPANRRWERSGEVVAGLDERDPRFKGILSPPEKHHGALQPRWRQNNLVSSPVGTRVPLFATHGVRFIRVLLGQRREGPTILAT